ncbi:hypothetical protein PF010_g19963 [Phytophthora fragariae]|uniref:Uncharacterized protein n=1 Tax=Phytophthora fragariae TaxID=53985 RepID=A0A6G0KFV2_9STRA|nr:hypothetical protein PF010_g19963 [Phytophthora fragariae]KAE9187467.1 hypothetical protein PF004_g22784 [Phytophthora fragariae]
MTCFGGVGEMQMRSARAAQGGFVERGPSVSGEFPITTSFSGELSPHHELQDRAAARDELLGQYVAVHHQLPRRLAARDDLLRQQVAVQHRLPDARALNQRAGNVALQYARLKPYTVQHQQKNMHVVLLESMGNHVLLGYTLSTKLQRSDTSKRKQVGLAPVSVPSVPSLGRQRCHQARMGLLSLDDDRIKSQPTIFKKNIAVSPKFNTIT